jgi:hypothetical protein
MLHPYSLLLEPFPFVIQEPPASYSFLTERHIQILWLEQKYFNHLKTANHETVKVISPGIWNSGSGPDFLKAHLLINGHDTRGDVEIHLSAEDWTRHRHHRDEKYENVVLHVFFWNCEGLKPAKNFRDQAISQVCLQTYLTISENEVMKRIDPDLYSHRDFVDSGCCAKSLFSKISEQEIAYLLGKAAEWRLMQKKNLILSKIEDPNLWFSAGVALALGFKNNQDAFLQIFLWLNKYQSFDENILLAMAMGACGLFKPTYSTKWTASSHYCYLHSLYTMLLFNIPHFPDIKLNLAQIRPLHHPVRRFVYLIKMIKDKSFPSYFSKILIKWKSHWKLLKSEKDFIQLKKIFMRLIPNYKSPYWNHHYLFDNRTATFSLTLMGDQLKQEILINICLPLLFHHLEPESEESKTLNAFYHHFAAISTSKTHYLMHRFFGDDIKGNLLSSAVNEQGAYQLHKDFCSHYEASCVGCPFVERYKNYFIRRCHKTFESI